MDELIKIAPRVANLAESATLAIDAKAKQMKAAGEDVVNFTAGEPDFDTPQHIKNAAKKALDEGKTKYAPCAGLLELRKLVCEKFRQDNGLEYSPAEVLVSIGAKHSLFNIIMTIVDRGDQVLIPAPYWVSYVEMVRAAEGVPVILPTTAEENFKITAEQLERACTPRTVAVLLNSPSNPTGSVYTADELRSLADVIVKKDLLCISDEIYEKLVYDNVEQVSIASFNPQIKDRTIVVNGFSKAFSMTGWRLGYAAGRKEIISAMNTLQSHSTSNATTFAQWGAVEALTSPKDELEKMRKAFDERRKLMVERLNAIPAVTCTMPGGAFYAFPDFSAYFGKSANGKIIENSMQLAEHLLDTAKVSVVPGVAFGAEKHMRFSYALSNSDIEKGISRISEAVQKLK
jgi:aspartate aminotransferase